MMLVALQLVGVVVMPSKVTVLFPRVAPKFVPLIMIAAPTTPEFGLRFVIPGAGGGAVNVNMTPLLACPPTVTTTLPVVAPVGTVVMMLVGLQLVGVANVPLNVTVLFPCACVAPKFVPVIVTGEPGGPEVGLSKVIVGD
jgi:hypothetical protein